MTDHADDRRRGSRRSVGTVLAPLARGQTYRNLLYLGLAFPLGLAYWIFLSFGLAFGVVLFVVGVGIAILLATVAGARLLARFERWLANRLLGTALEAPADRPAADGIWTTIKGYVDAPSTWRGLGFLGLKLWLGIVGFLLLFFLWNSLELVTAPARYPTMIEFGTVNGDPVGWTIDSLPEAIGAIPIGVVLAVVILHLSNAVAYVAERIALALLDGDAAADAGGGDARDA